MRRVMGIDLALHVTGYALIIGKDTNDVTPEWTGSGLISVKGNKITRGERLTYLGVQLRDYIEEVVPVVVVCESPPWLKASHRTSKKTMEDLTMALGVVEMVCYQAGVRLVVVDPGYAKLGIGGHVRAQKDTVAQGLWTRGYATIGDISHDETDALSIALAWWLAEGRFEGAE